MARDQQRRLLADEGTRAQVEVAASRMVGELFNAAEGERLLSAESKSDHEFADDLVDCELALIAVGEEPLRIALRLAVLSIARDSVRTYAEIHALPRQEGQVQP